MRVALIGGTGFVGSYLVDQLLEQGQVPRILVRRGSEARVRDPQRCEQVSGEIGNGDAAERLIAGTDAVIYNIGILREFPDRGITFQALQFEGARRAIDLAKALDVRRFLLMSANGVKPEGTPYQRTKYEAERYLEASGLDWTIFRPSVIFGDPRGRMEFASQLNQEIVQMPIPAPLFYDGLLPFDAGRFRLSPVHVGDVAKVFVEALGRADTFGQTIALGGPEALEWREILRTIAGVTGRRLLAVPAPAWAVKVVAGLFERIPDFPITRDQITMLMEGNTCDASETFRRFQIQPQRFDAVTLRYLSGKQD